MLRLILPLLLGLLSPSILFAAEDWTQYRVAVRVEGETSATPLRPVALLGARYLVQLALAPGREVAIVLEPDAAGGYRGADSSGLTGALAGGERESWRVEVDAPAGPAGGPLSALGRALRGTRRADGSFVEASRKAFTLSFTPLRGSPAGRSDPRRWGRGAASALLAEAGLSDLVPPAPLLVPGVGAPEAEVRAALEEHRPDELTILFWNVGKGEHRAVGPRVPLPGGQTADALSANVRALAARLRPDLLVLAEVTTGAEGTLDPDTRAVLRALYPGQLAVPAMWEHPTSNNNAIFSRWDLVQVAGDERTAQPDGGYDTRAWTLPGAPAPGERTATVQTRWLDWTPLDAAGDLAKELEYRRAWTRKSNWHTRASVRVDFTLGGLPCTVFPLHLAMPWLELEPSARRGGFLVDGIQHHQLTTTDPLYHQIARLRDDLGRVPHGRMLLIGDTNIAEFPRANFPPLRQDDAATGDGAPARSRSLAFELLSQGLHNAFQGDREAWSWPNPSGSDGRVHALARNLIDNCLHGAGFEVRYRAVLFPRGADHGAIAVKVRLRRSGAPLAPFRPVRRDPPLGLDVSPPVVEVTAPARGALVPLASELLLAGRVTDASGVASLVVSGREVPVGVDGSFRATVPLREGLNLIELTASDAAGNVARGWRSVVAGRALPAAPVEDALVVRLNRPAFTTAEEQVATRLAAVDLDAALKARNPLYQDTLAKGRLSVDVKVDATSASTGAPRVSLTPEAGGLRVRVTLPDVAAVLAIEGRLHLWGWNPSPIRTSARLSARSATVEAVAKVEVAPDGRITTRLEQTRVTFDGFLVQARLLPTFAQPIVSRAVERVVSDQLAQKVTALVPPALDAFLAKAVAPIERQVLGRALTARVLPRSAVFDAHGLSLTLAADLDLARPADAGPAPALGTHTGSLATSGAAPALGGTASGVGHGGQSMIVAVNDDLLNRLGFAAWRSGALALAITPDSAPRLGLPAWLGRIDSTFLGGILPEAVAGLPAGTPLELEVAPAAPPVFRAQPGGKLELGLGDVGVKVFAAPAGGPRRLLLQVSASALVPCTASLDAEGRLSVVAAGAPTLHVDLFDSPVTALHQTGIEGVLDLALPQVLSAMLGKLSSLPLPSTADLRPANVRLSTEGPGADFLAIGGDLR